MNKIKGKPIHWSMLDHVILTISIKIDRWESGFCK